jgi:colanic acid/amylovoran biosynthesis glycosyltransferase
VRILSVGTLEEKKGQHLVIEALYKLMRDYGIENYEYHLVGSGDYDRNILKTIEKYNLNERVFMHGFVPYGDPRLLLFYQQADIFTLPSITLRDHDKEGIPGTVVEAMAGGLPIVSTYHAGIPAVIRNEEEGLLIEEKDIDGITEALVRLIRQPALRKKLGRNAAEKANRELDLYVGTKRLETIYSRAITGSEINRGSTFNVRHCRNF